MLYSVCFFPQQDFIDKAIALRKRLHDYSDERLNYISHCVLFKSFFADGSEGLIKNELEHIIKKHESFKVFTTRVSREANKNLVVVGLIHSKELFNLRDEVHGNLEKYIDHQANRNSEKKIFVPSRQDFKHFREVYLPKISLCKTDASLNGINFNYFENYGINVKNISLMIKRQKWEKIKDYELLKLPEFRLSMIFF